MSLPERPLSSTQTGKGVALVTQIGVRGDFLLEKSAEWQCGRRARIPGAQADPGRKIRAPLPALFYPLLAREAFRVLARVLGNCVGVKMVMCFRVIYGRAGTDAKGSQPMDLSWGQLPPTLFTHLASLRCCNLRWPGAEVKEGSAQSDSSPG